MERRGPPRAERGCGAEVSAAPGGDRFANVRVYSAPHCKACELAKAYLQEKGVSYVEVDVAQDPEALLRMTGRLSIPVVEIGGRFVIGFSRRQLDQLLQECAATTV